MVTGAPNGAPSTMNCTLVTVAESATEACSVVAPDTTPPSLGLVMVTAGREITGVTCCRTFTVVPVICSCVSVTLWSGPCWAK